MNLDSHPEDNADASTRLVDDPTSLTDDITGLPGLCTWPKVYLLVFVVFVAYVVFLTVLSRAFA